MYFKQEKRSGSVKLEFTKRNIRTKDEIKGVNYCMYQGDIALFSLRASKPDDVIFDLKNIDEQKAEIRIYTYDCVLAKTIKLYSLKYLLLFNIQNVFYKVYSRLKRGPYSKNTFMARIPKPNIKNIRKQLLFFCEKLCDIKNNNSSVNNNLEGLSSSSKSRLY